MKNKVLTVKCILLAMAISVTTAQAQTKTTTRSSTSRYETSNGNTWMNVESESVNDPNKKITLYKNGEVYKIKLTNDKINELFIDEKKIPAEDFPKYESMVKEILVQYKKDMEQAARDREQADRDRKQAERDRAQAELDRQQAGRDRERAEVDRKQAEKDREQADRDREQAGKHREQADRDRQQAEIHRAQAHKDREQGDRDRHQATLDRAQAERDRAQAQKDRAQAEIDRKQAAEDRKLMADLIDELVEEKVVADKDDIRRLQLTDESLIVNDKKQSAELHQKMKAKYLKKNGTRINYHNDSSGRGISMERND